MIEGVIIYILKHLTKFRILALFAIIYAGIIYYLSSSTTGVPMEVLHRLPVRELVGVFERYAPGFLREIASYGYNNIDKIAHIILYFGFGILLHLTFRNSDKDGFKKYAGILAITTGMLYGIYNEINQSFIPGRVASTADMIANGIGLIIAQIFIFFILIKLIKGKNKNEK